MSDLVNDLEDHGVEDDLMESYINLKEEGKHDK